MNLDTYTEAAIKTESVIDHVYCNKAKILNLLEIMIQAGNLLDDMKKNVFYGRPYQETKQFDAAFALTSAVDDLNCSMFSNFERVDVNNTISYSKIENLDPRIFHGAIGMATESVEMLEALKTYIETGELDKTNMGEECGDSDWYEAILLDALGVDWTANMAKNIEKLKLRYAKQFTAAAANARDLEAERKLLES